MGRKGWLAWRRWVTDLGRHSQRKKAFFVHIGFGTIQYPVLLIMLKEEEGVSKFLGLPFLLCDPPDFVHLRILGKE